MKYKQKQTIKRKLKNKTKKKGQLHHSHHSHHSHNTLIQTHKPIYEKQYVLLPILKGGKFVDRGGYGCVVTPAISCSSSDINLDKSVSKIVRNPDNSDVSTELKISDFLKKIDPLQTYFITYNKQCHIHNIPKDRTDLISVKYKDDDMTKYYIVKDRKDKDRKDSNSIYNTKKDKNVCDIELDLNPLNLIMKHGGHSLSKIMKVNRKTKGIAAEMHQLFVDDLKYYFKHLIIGLIKMHENKIVNRDIKQRNILLKMDEHGKNDKQLMEIRYIDFGLSDIITSNMYNIKNITVLKGTYFYLSPEIFISYIVAKYYNRSRNYQMKNIMAKINKNVKSALYIINEKESINSLNKTIETLYNKVNQELEKRTKK